MAKFLSDEWIDAVAGRAGSPDASDLSVRLQIAVDDVRFHAVIADGALAELAPGALPDADVSLTLQFDDAVAIQRGALDPSVAFMQGRMKTAGDPGKLLELLACAARPGFARFREEVAASTDF